MMTRRHFSLAYLAAMASLVLAPALTQAQATGTFWPAADSGVKIENVSINNSPPPLTVKPETALAVDLDYTIIDARCPGCIDQIQYGWVNTATPRCRGKLLGHRSR